MDESGFSENPKTQFSTGMVWVLTSKELILQTFTSSKSEFQLRFGLLLSPYFLPLCSHSYNTTSPKNQKSTMVSRNHQMLQGREPSPKDPSSNPANSVQCFVMIFLQKSQPTDPFILIGGSKAVQSRDNYEIFHLHQVGF